jgi:hypothetical protein
MWQDEDEEDEEEEEARPSKAQRKHKSKPVKKDADGKRKQKTVWSTYQGFGARTRRDLSRLKQEMVQRARQMAGVGRSSAPISEQLHWERMMAWMQRTQEEVNQQVIREVALSQSGLYFNHMVPSHKSSHGVPADPSMTYFNPTMRPVMPKSSSLHPPMPLHVVTDPTIPLHPSVAAATQPGWFPIAFAHQNTAPVPTSWPHGRVSGVPSTPPPGSGIPFPVPNPGSGIPCSFPEPKSGIPYSPVPVMPNAIPNPSFINAVPGAIPRTPPSPEPKPRAAPTLGVPRARVPAPVPRTPGASAASMQAPYSAPDVSVSISCPKGWLLMLLSDWQVV